MSEKLYVLSMLENPQGWKSRYKNFSVFQEHMQNSGVELYIAEIAFGNAEFQVTENGDDPQQLQLRAEQTPWMYGLWHKENALNLLMHRLPHDAKYIAWIDGDVQFARPNWAEETVRLLQQYQVVQMFSHGQDLGPNYEPLFSGYGAQSVGAVYQYRKSPEEAWTAKPPDSCKSQKGNWLHHPGLAWAAHRDTLNHLGGLLDFALLGSGDALMCASLFGEVKRVLGKNYETRYTLNYIENILLWQERANKFIQGNVGYVPGLILHHWHGRKVDRTYAEKAKLLMSEKFDPALDLKQGIQGLYMLTERNPDLRDGLSRYAAQQKEDATEA